MPQSNHFTNDAGQGSYYDQLAVMQTQYNNLSKELSNLQTKADSPNNKNLFNTTGMLNFNELKRKMQLTAPKVH